jgi:cobaltochelatase CobT
MWNDVSYRKNLFNAIEDWRVENRLAAVFPGCRHNFHELIRRFFVEDATRERAGEISLALSVLNYVLLTVRSWDVPEVSQPLREETTSLDTHFPGMRQPLDLILAQIRQGCPDTSSAIHYARQLAHCLKSWKSPSQEEQNQESGTQTENTSASEKGREASTSAASAQETSSVGNSCLPAGETGQDRLSGIPTIVDTLPVDMGNWLGKQLEAHAAGDSGRKVEMAVEGFCEVHLLPDQDREKAVRMATALKARMLGMLQAHTLRHAISGRQGKLETGKLYRLSTGSPRVFQKRASVHKLDTAVHILLDSSGSMHGESIKLAVQACYAVGKALEHLSGISLGITSFPAYRDGKIGVFPLVKHGQKMTDRMQMQAHGGTPLAEALWWVMRQMLILKETRKVVLILTDGVPDDVPQCLQALEALRKTGVEVYGIGMKFDCISSLLPDTSSRVISRFEELSPALFEVLQHALLRETRYD